MNGALVHIQNSWVNKPANLDVIVSIVLVYDH